jgi:hypothetical protein
MRAVLGAGETQHRGTPHGTLARAAGLLVNGPPAYRLGGLRPTGLAASGLPLSGPPASLLEAEPGLEGAFLKAGLHRGEEPRGVRAVHQPVIVGQGQVDH